MIQQDFEYSEDRSFFAQLFGVSENELLLRYRALFDFRALVVKRALFQLQRIKLWEQLRTVTEPSCFLQLSSHCTGTQQLVLDHLIPLATNELNKKLRKQKAAFGHKVSAQSFGSNNLENLTFACTTCNNYKKHRLPSAELIQRHLKRLDEQRLPRS